MSEVGKRLVMQWKQKLAKIRESQAQNKQQSTDQKTQPVEHTERLSYIKKMVYSLKNTKEKAVKEIYFLKGQGLLGFMMFTGSSVVYFSLFALLIGLFVLPITFLICLCLALIGLGRLSNIVASLGLVISVVGAQLLTILYFAEMNVRLYKEKQF